MRGGVGGGGRFGTADGGFGKGEVVGWVSAGGCVRGALPVGELVGEFGFLGLDGKEAGAAGPVAGGCGRDVAGELDEGVEGVAEEF